MSLFVPPLRPPGAVDEETFLRKCVRCGKCVAACPRESIELAGGLGRSRRTPQVRPRRKPCYLCMKCPPVCPTGALDTGVKEIARAGMGQAYILKDRCHNYKAGTMCMTCYDRCPLRGTAVVLSGGLVPAMTTACVGCGICDYVCPVQAVEIVPASSRFVPPMAAPTEKAPGGKA